MRRRGALGVRDQRVDRPRRSPAAVRDRSADARRFGESILARATHVLRRGTLSRVILRDIIESDLPIFFELQREPEGNALAAFPARDRDAFMKHWHERVLGDQSGKKKAIVEDGHVVGNIVSWDQDGHREIGYWLGKAFWGRGIASAAVAAYVKDIDTTRPMHAYVAKENHGSIRALEKSGFARVGEAVEEDGTTMVHFELRE